MGDSLSWLERGGLALLLIGMVGAAAHDAGIAGSSWLLRHAATPRYAWSAIILGVAILNLGPVLT